jgi:microcystin-dependent protein
MEVFIGEIFLFAFNFVSEGFLLCDGSFVSTAKYTALYTMIGNDYGGDKNNFNLPDLMKSSPLPKMNYYIAASGQYPQH